MTSCGLTNLATCIPEKFFGFLLSIFNAPLEALIKLTKGMLTEPVNINLFFSLWAIIVYIISMFYGLFFLFAGFNFLISGYDVVKREKAKMWLRNIVLMIIFVQASFLIYDLIIELGSLLTSGVIGMIKPEFFLLNADNLGSFALQFVLAPFYLITVIITVLLLGFRYLMVSIGVVMFPFALFFYFIPPLQNYGKMILNVLLIFIFLTFFDAIILLGASALLSIPLFADFKIIIVTSAFGTVNLLMIFMILFALTKAAFSVTNSEVGKTVTKAVKYLV